MLTPIQERCIGAGTIFVMFYHFVILLLCVYNNRMSYGVEFDDRFFWVPWRIRAPTDVPRKYCGCTEVTLDKQQFDENAIDPAFQMNGGYDSGCGTVPLVLPQVLRHFQQHEGDETASVPLMCKFLKQNFGYESIDYTVRDPNEPSSPKSPKQVKHLPTHTEAFGSGQIPEAAVKRQVQVIVGNKRCVNEDDSRFSQCTVNLNRFLGGLLNLLFCYASVIIGIAVFVIVLQSLWLCLGMFIFPERFAAAICGLTFVVTWHICTVCRVMPFAAGVGGMCYHVSSLHTTMKTYFDRIEKKVPSSSPCLPLVTHKCIDIQPPTY